MLYISTATEYGLNLLVILAKNGRRMTLQEISKKGKMPYRFLTKIVKPLIKAKLINAKEGKAGGYLLLPKPATIKIKYVLEALGEPLSLVLCLTHKKCPTKQEKTCKMRPIWEKIKMNIDKELNKTTLKDLI